MKLHVTFFPNVFGKQVKHHDVDWPQLVKALSKPKAYRTKMCMPMWSPARFGDVAGLTMKARRDGTDETSFKHAGNLIGPVCCAVVDIDKVTVSPDEAATRMSAAGLRGLVVTTASNANGAPHYSYRAVAPLASPVATSEVQRLAELMNRVLGGIVAPESEDEARCYFYGRLQGAEGFAAIETQGACLDELTIEHLALPARPEHKKTSSAAGMDADCADFVRETRALPDDIKSVIEAFNEHVGHLEFIRETLEANGYTPEPGPPWRRPGSTNPASVKVLTDGKKITSFHENDPLCGGPRDAFDVAKILLFGGDFPKALKHARQVLVDAGVLDEAEATPATAEPQSPGPSPRKGLRALRLDELQQMPRASWLIKGVLPTQGLACLYGPSGVGKSFALLDMGLSIARGVEWQGQRVTHAAVIHIAAEGGHGFSQRLEVYGKRHGVDVARFPFFVCPSGFDLRSGPDVAEVVAMAEEVSAQGLRVGLVVIDTLNRVLPGADENAASDMSAAVAGMAQIAEKLGCLVAIVHHSGKDASKGARGHSSLRAAMDTELSVDRADTDSPLRIIKVTKQRDGADDLKFGFTLEPTFLRYDEDEVTEIVVPVAMAAPVDAVKRGRRAGRPSAWAPALQQALDGLDGPAPEEQVIAAAKAAYSAAGGAAGKNSAASIRRELQRLADGGLVELASGLVSVTEVDPLS